MWLLFIVNPKNILPIMQASLQWRTLCLYTRRTSCKVNPFFSTVSSNRLCRISFIGMRWNLICLTISLCYQSRTSWKKCYNFVLPCCLEQKLFEIQLFPNLLSLFKVRTKLSAHLMSCWQSRIWVDYLQ